jgi:hypothetical protein
LCLAKNNQKLATPGFYNYFLAFIIIFIPKNSYQTSDSIVDFFLNLIDSPIIEKILTYTNKKLKDELPISEWNLELLLVLCYSLA